MTASPEPLEVWLCRFRFLDAPEVKKVRPAVILEADEGALVAVAVKVTSHAPRDEPGEFEVADLVRAGPVLDDVRGFYHAFKIADAASVAVLRLLGGLVFKVFAQIAERAGALDLFDQLGHQLELAVIQLLLHHVDVLLC